MDLQLQVSSSPHTRDTITTRKIMALVLVALIPSCLIGVLSFGAHALLVLALSVCSSIVSEAVYEKVLNKTLTITDGSAAVTGLLIGMNMPPEISWWIPCLGSVFAIIVVKMLYGGLGQNFMNPALAARCFLLVSFAGKMTTFTSGAGIFQVVTEVSSTTDALSGATPLAYLKTGALFDLKSLFFGNVTGCIGETSAAALLIGGIFLVWMGVLSIRIPSSYLGTFAVLTLITSIVRGYGTPFIYTLEQLCAGGLMLGAWFMATDYVTSPITQEGQIVYGILLGVLTWIFRMIGTSAEGVSYAIIFMNLLVPIIERYTRPVAFGVNRQPRGGKLLIMEKAKNMRRQRAALDSSTAKGRKQGADGVSPVPPDRRRDRA